MTLSEKFGGVLKDSVFDKFLQAEDVTLTEKSRVSSNYILSLENNYFVPKIIIFVRIKIGPLSNYRCPSFNYLCLFKNNCTNEDNCQPIIILAHSFFILN